MTLVPAIRLEYLEQCAADILAANDSLHAVQAKRNIELAIWNADQAINHTSNHTRRIA